MYRLNGSGQTQRCLDQHKPSYTCFCSSGRRVSVLLSLRGLTVTVWRSAGIPQAHNFKTILSPKHHATDEYLQEHNIMTALTV